MVVVFLKGFACHIVNLMETSDRHPNVGARGFFFPLAVLIAHDVRAFSRSFVFRLR